MTKSTHHSPAGTLVGRVMSRMTTVVLGRLLAWPGDDRRIEQRIAGAEQRIAEVDAIVLVADINRLLAELRRREAAAQLDHQLVLAIGDPS